MTRLVPPRILILPSSHMHGRSLFILRWCRTIRAHGVHGVGGTNSCGSMHGVVMHDNSSGVHVNSCGALGQRNSCNLHAAAVQGRTRRRV